MLVGSVVAYVFVPHEVLMPVAWALLAIAVAGVLAIRAYTQRLNVALAVDRDGDETAIRERQILLAEFGVLLALVGLAAFIILLVEYTG